MLTSRSTEALHCVLFSPTNTQPALAHFDNNRLKLRPNTQADALDISYDSYLSLVTDQDVKKVHWIIKIRPSPGSGELEDSEATLPYFYVANKQLKVCVDNRMLASSHSQAL